MAVGLQLRTLTELAPIAKAGGFTASKAEAARGYRLCDFTGRCLPSAAVSASRRPILPAVSDSKNANQRQHAVVLPELHAKRPDHSVRPNGQKCLKCRLSLWKNTVQNWTALLREYNLGASYLCCRRSLLTEGFFGARRCERHVAEICTRCSQRQSPILRLRSGAKMY